MAKHPNAATGAVGGLGPGILVVWLLGRYGVDMGAEVGGVVAVSFSSLFLFIGRRGLRGLWDRLLNGIAE